VAPYHFGSKTTPPTYPQPREPTSFFKMNFKAYGHLNISAKHRTTIEFTKDDYLTPQGDCIVGIKADFTVPDHDLGKIEIKITVDGNTEVIHAVYNPGFCDPRELVIRKSDFKDDRTFAVGADKAALDLSREMVNKMQNADTEIQVLVTSWE